MNAAQFARFCAFMEYPIDDVIDELQTDPYYLPAQDAGELARKEYREFQEREIGDEHAITALKHSGGAHDG